MTLKQFIVFTGSIVVLITGCTKAKGNIGKMSVYEAPDIEAEWIRAGDPIVFEEGKWYPQDKVDIFLDSEVYPVGEHEGVRFFIDKTDVRPYKYLYTKFGRHKFRLFKRNVLSDDSR